MRRFIVPPVGILTLIIFSSIAALGQARTAERLVTSAVSQLNQGNPPEGSVRFAFNAVPNSNPCTTAAVGAAEAGTIAVKIQGVWVCLPKSSAVGVGTGDVTGPSASSVSELAVFNVTTGKGLGRSNTLTGYVKVASGVVTAAPIPIADLPTMTSAQFAGVISNETGTNLLVFNTSPNIITPTGITKADIGLPLTDNTSDATKNSAAVVLTNKTISGDDNTLTNLPAGNIVGVIPIENLATGTPDGSKFIRDDGTLQAIPGGGDALQSSGLDQFAATTSAQLATVLSDESGTAGGFTRATNPVFVTPTLGVATATSINKVAVTAPATSATLTIADGATLSAPSTATVSGTNTGDQTSVTGNAGTATALQTPRAINGVNFDGTAAITVTAAAGTLTGATLAAGVTASSLTSFGASPTLVTPDIGTPSAGVATNLTGTATGLTVGTAQAGDSATAFFSAGTVEAARLPALSGLTGSVTDAQVPNNITIDLATAATTATSATTATTATTAETGDSATAFFGAGALEKARQHALTVYNDAGNTYSTGAQDFASATSLKVPTSAGAAPTASGLVAYDSTAHRFGGGHNGANKVFVTPDSSDTLTNKTINASSNPISNLGVSNFSGGSVVGNGTKFQTSAIANPASNKCIEVDANGVLQIAGSDSTCGAGGGGDMSTSGIQTVTGAKTFNSGKLILAGATSGTTTLNAAAVAGTTTLTLPAATDTLIGRDTTDTLTNKTLTSPVINAPTGIVKADVGLSNVDNTSDANKPVSTAQQTALDLKAPLASPTLTGVPAAPTAAVDTNTTQLATTAYVVGQGYAKLVSPSFTTPTLGVATATSINKVAITAPATSATLTVDNGKTLRATNTLTLSGTDSTVMTFPSTSATIARTDAANTFTGASTATSWNLATPALTLRTQADNTAIVANSPYVNTADGKLMIGNNAGSANGEIFVAGVSLVNLASNVTGFLPGANISSLVNAQTGTTYTVVDGDRGKLVTHTNAGAIAVTLPQAGASSEFVAGWHGDFQNRGAGTATITPTTSTIDGAASLALTTNQGVRIFSDGTNYFTQRGVGGAGGGSGTITSGATNAIPKYTASTTIDDSLAADDGTTFTYSGTGGISSTAAVTGVLSLNDTNQTHTLDITPGSNLTANRVFTITTSDAARTLNMGGDITTAAAFTTSGANALTLTTTGATNITLPTTGTLAAVDGTATLSNKRIVPRVTTIVSSATPTINTDVADAVTITALAAAITSMTTNLTGTPNNFDRLLIRFKDDGTLRSITWGASFVSSQATLPTTTVASKVTTVGLLYDSVKAKWVCVAVDQEP